VEGPLLAVRAGIGGAEPASLGDAARQLGISTHRAARIERRGLRQLRAAGRSGACAPGAAASRRSIALGTSGAAVPPLQPAVLLTPRPALKTPAALASPSGASGPSGGRGAPGPSSGSTGGSTQSRPAAVQAENASSKTAAYLAGLALFALLLAALAVAWRRRAQTPAARLAEQTGTAAVWWPPARPELPPGPPEPPFVAAEVAAEGSVAVSGSDAESSNEEAPTGEHPPVADTARDANAAPISDTGPTTAAGAADTAAGAPTHRRRPRRGAVAAASLVSLGVALLRRRRR
jgi:hypothetical protein